MKTPQFKHLTFKRKSERDSWVKKNTFFKLVLKDLGQDLQFMYVHETGEILQCDFQSEIYAGKFIDTSRVIPGQPLHILEEEKNKYLSYSRLIIDSVTLVIRKK